MFIVCKQKLNGDLVAGTPPKVHADYEAAKEEAERLAASAVDAKSFVIFSAIARSERTQAPVTTTHLA